ncbi:hypothetical protein FRC15_000110 [Serendipita sp. 397]|nr:hypothetical protein FRC15_000110 [Serendipita sp. 397]
MQRAELEEEGNEKQTHQGRDSTFPLPLQVEQIKNDVQLGLGVATLVAEIKIDGTIAQKRAEIEDIKLKKCSIPKVQLIPQEVLSIIFEFYMSNGFQNPWLLMQICRQWRIAATHTRSIWSKIMVTSSRQRAAERRTFDGYEFCHTTALLRDALARTGQGPIDLRCNFNRTFRQQGSRNFAQRMFDVLRATGAHHRIRSLKIGDPHLNNINDLEVVDLSGFQLFALKKVDLAWSSPGLNECIQKTAHRLEDLSFTTCYEDTRYDWDLSRQVALSDLLFYSSVEALGQVGAQMISSAPNLVNLSLISIKVEHPTDEPVSIPTLRLLHLNSTDIGCKVVFPNLEVLCIRNSTLSTSADQPLILPCLIWLELSQITVNRCSHIHARSLQNLIVNPFTRSEPIMERLFEIGILPGYLVTQSICLRSASVDSVVLADILDQMLGLVRLHLTDLALDNGFFERLAGHSLDSTSISDPTKPICTSLEAILVDTSKLSEPVTKQEMVKWFGKAMESRAQGQFPLKKAQMKEQCDDKWIDFL